MRAISATLTAVPKQRRSLKTRRWTEAKHALAVKGWTNFNEALYRKILQIKFQQENV